ncbi:MAG: head GIN domain-containing protein [Bacteroidota bacterium]
MKQQSFVLVFFTALFILFCHTIVEAQWGTRGNGDVTKQTRKVSNFDAVSVGGGIDLYIRQGSSYEVVVETDENLQDLIRTEVRGDRLKIYVEKSIWRSEEMNVYVTLPQLNELMASGGSDVYSKGTIRSDEFKLNANGGSDVHLELDVNTLIANASGGSDTELRGTVERMELSASGGSDFDGRDVQVNYAKIRASGGSDSYIHVNKEVDIEASGASDVYLYGDAKIIHKSVSGASDFHRRS